MVNTSFNNFYAWFRTYYCKREGRIENMWTGHFLVDYGLATICAWANTHTITESALKHAYQQMENELKSNETFYRGRAHGLIPNSTFTQHSHDLNECLNNLSALYQQAVKSLQPGPDICHICGRSVVYDENAPPLKVSRLSDFPLLSGMFNFYLELQPGMQVCGLCRFAVTTLLFTQPVQSIYTYKPNRKRKGEYKRTSLFVVPHVQYMPWLAFHIQQATNNARSASLSGSKPQSDRLACHPDRLALRLLVEFYSNTKQMLPPGTPFTVWFVNSANESVRAYLRYYTIPNPVITWAQKLTELVLFRFPHPRPPLPFLEESTILNTSALLQSRYVPIRLTMDEDGNWTAHRDRWYVVRRFLEEVEMIDPSVPAAIYEIVVGLVGTDKDTGDRILREMVERDDRRLSRFRKRLLQAVRDGKVSSHAAGLFLTFDLYRSVGYLKVCLYDYVHWLNEGQRYAFDINIPPLTGKTDLQQLIEQIAGRIAGHHYARNLYHQLARARGMKQVRNYYARLAQYGLLSWSEFLQLYEPDFLPSSDLTRQAIRHNLAVKDYLLVCLASALGATVPTPDDDEEVE